MPTLSPHPARWSIRTLLIVLVAAMVIPLVSLSAFFGYRAYRTDQQRAEEEMAASAEAAATGVRRFLRDAEGVLAGVASDPGIRSLDPGRCAVMMRQFRGLVHPLYTNLATWTVDGRPVCSMLPGPDTLPMKGVPGFKEALAAEGFYVTPVQIGRRSGLWSTHFIYPIHDARGMHTGMISAAVDLDSFQGILRSLDVRDNAIITLLEPDGTIVARTRNGRALVGTRIRDTRFPKVAAGQLPSSGVIEEPSVEGEAYTFAYVLIPEVGWVVTAGRPTRDITGPLRALRLWLFLGLLVAAGSVLAVWLAYRRITRPLQVLLDEISAARPGEPAGVGTDGPREIAWVAEHFNRAWSAWAESEKARERSHERFRSMVDNAVTGIFVSTEAGRFVEVNQAMVDLLGYTDKEELLATPLDTLYGSTELRSQYLDEYGGRASFRGVPVEWRRKEGETVQLRLTGRRMVLEDGQTGWEIVVDDVTELTRLQVQYLQAQKMEALGRFAGGIAHDFNNILTVVQGEADMLREDPGLDDDQREQIGQIYDAAVRGGALNHQLLAFSRRSATEKRPTDLNEVVRDIEILLRRTVGEDIDLHLELEPDLGLVRVNPSQIEQVVMNLCVNARDAMPGGGELTVSTTGVDAVADEIREYAGSGQGRHVVLAVSDTGQGIPADVLPHVFEPFFTTKPAHKGTGLGLSTVYGIIADAGGSVAIDSEPEAGTTIRVFLPVHEGSVEVEAPPAADPTSEAGSGVVLVAEDESGVRELAERVLQRAGYEVLTAADGDEAFRVAMEHAGPIDVLLSDVVMPGIGGQELAERLAAHGRVRRVVLFSGYPEGMTENGPAGVLAWRFLSKPFTASALSAAVASVLATPEDDG